MEQKSEITKTGSSSQQFEALFHHATIGIIIANKEGAIINSNSFATELFKYGKDELIGKKIEVLVPNQYKQKHEVHRDSFNANPHNRAMGANRDLFGQKKDGSVFPVEISLSYYKEGDELFAIAFIIDISVRKTNEKLLLKQKEELEQKSSEILKMNFGLEKMVEDRTMMLRETLQELENSRYDLNEALNKEKELSDLKSRFVTMASHEFRTPLSTILSSASLLSKYLTTEEQNKRDKHIVRIKESVSSMKNILEDFLSLGKLEDGLVTARIETIEFSDFKHVLETLIEDMQQISKIGQTIEFNSTGTCQITTDLNLIKNIIINLVSNAIKFSPEHTAIKIYCNVSEDGFTASIQDSGIGISTEDQEHLFQRFFRAKNAINIQGTGLGLHIVAKYLELLDGKIECRSNLNEGTTFTIFIPAFQNKI